MITIDQFKTVELRVATVVSAEPHPNADRLVVLRVDLGSEQRQIVAGIRGHYTAEALPEIIQRLRAKGYELVTVGQLIAPDPGGESPPPSSVHDA